MRTRFAGPIRIGIRGIRASRRGHREAWTQTTTLDRCLLSRAETRTHLRAYLFNCPPTHHGPGQYFRLPARIRREGDHIIIRQRGGYDE